MNRSLRTQQRQHRQFEKTKAVAHQLYLNRINRGQEGDEKSDWKLAEDIVRDLGRFSSFKHYYRTRNPWRGIIQWWESTLVEKGLETLVNDLKNLAFFDLAALLANITIIISLGTFLIDGERRQHDEQVYSAWQVITNAHGQPGNGGRIRALEFLNSTPGTPGRRRWFGLPWARESLQGIDLSQAFLTGIDLPYADLVAANLQDTELEDANLQNANLRAANLQDADLEDSYLQGAILSYANLQDADLEDSYLRDAKLFEANLKNSDLAESNLTGASLFGADLQNADLTEANLQNADLSYANLEGANLGLSNLLSTDLRLAEGLTPEQLTTGEQTTQYRQYFIELPVLICNTALPPTIKNIDPDRDCDEIPERLRRFYWNLSLEDAQKIVDESRRKTWD